MKSHVLGGTLRLNPDKAGDDSLRSHVDSQSIILHFFLLKACHIYMINNIPYYTPPPPLLTNPRPKTPKVKIRKKGFLLTLYSV